MCAPPATAHFALNKEGICAATCVCVRAIFVVYIATLDGFSSFNFALSYGDYYKFYVIVLVGKMTVLQEAIRHNSLTATAVVKINSEVVQGGNDR